MFSFISPQAIHFGRGQSQNVSESAKMYGNSVLIVHGSSASRAEWLVTSCKNAGLTTTTLSCQNEPSLPDIEFALRQINGVFPDVVIGLGGGSVIDFAKAMAALIRCEGPPLDYLEVVGTGCALEHDPIAMIALPTTAGTGAEVTKNAVISVPEHGLKVSLRDPRMVPDIAIVDADLMRGAPRRVALAAGLDAITQVIEPYLSTKANPMTDAICHGAIPVGLSVLRDLGVRGCDRRKDQCATWRNLRRAPPRRVEGASGKITARNRIPRAAGLGDRSYRHPFRRWKERSGFTQNGTLDQKTGTAHFGTDGPDTRRSFRGRRANRKLVLNEGKSFHDVARRTLTSPTLLRFFLGGRYRKSFW